MGKLAVFHRLAGSLRFPGAMRRDCMAIGECGDLSAHSKDRLQIGGNPLAVTYKDAGVDIDKKMSAIQGAKATIAGSHNANVLAGVGHFGGLFSLSSLKDMDDPVAVSSTDSVGTKVEVAVLMDDFSTIGEDIVHHCVNDILCCGARPLFFLDYVGTSSIKSDHFQQIVEGLSKACKAHDCPLVSGETAEMPGIYYEGCVDLVGSIVGVVERAKILDGSEIREGDLLLGLKSDGLHTNGYTLARKVLLKDHTVHDHIDSLELSIGEELLRIHRSYYQQVSPLADHPAVSGLAHITGGGILDNVGRLMRGGLDMEVDWDSWEMPALFQTIQSLGPVPDDDMRHTFNLGIGFIVIVHANGLDEVQRALEETGEETTLIGRIIKSTES